MGKIFSFLLVTLLLTQGIVLGQLIENNFSPEWWEKRINNQLLVGDCVSAKNDAKTALQLYPQNLSLQKIHARALFKNGDEEMAINIIQNLGIDYQLLEEGSWAILEKGLRSDQYTIRLVALVGAYLTNDANGIKLLVEMLREPNAVLRGLAVRLSSDLPDAVLKEEILRILEEERVWQVRMEAIQASGKMRLKEASSKLTEILKDDDESFEEKNLAIASLVAIYDKIALEELESLVKSPFFAMRVLGCRLAAHFEVKKGVNLILPLLADPISDVRLAALKALGFYYSQFLNEKEFLSYLEPLLEDCSPQVSILAAHFGLLNNNKPSEVTLKKWLLDKRGDSSYFAAAALGNSGKKGKKLALEMLSQELDSYAKVNLVLGLVGQRIEVKKCADILYGFLKNKKEKIVWEIQGNFPFRILSPSYLKHAQQLPHYPEFVNTASELELFALLAIIGDNRAEEAIRTFLQQKGWGISGMAAATLLKEGDEASLKILRKLLLDKDPMICSQAALVLALFGKDESVIPILEKSYVGADRELQLRILEALGEIGNKGCLPFFVKALQEQFPVLRLSAASSLIKCLNK